MKNKVGLWIDHKKAVIVSITDGKVTTKTIESGMEAHVRFSGGARSHRTPYGPQEIASESRRDEKYNMHLKSYYEKVIYSIHNAAGIFIFGPGEAKIEFKKQIEFRTLVGEGIREKSQIKSEAQRMVKSGRCEVLVISLGAAGALAVSESFVEHILPPTVPIVSKVGAGDSMVAGIVLSLARGRPLMESILFGVAAGTAAVMTPGTELCRREDAERLFEDMVSGL
jgi:hypothetical protein